MLDVTARPATNDDLFDLVRMYHLLEAEMTPLHAMWPRADGLPTPLEPSFAALLADDDVVVIIGELDGLPFGFMVGRVEPLLDPSEVVGAIRFVFTEFEAREVGVGETMRALLLDTLRARGITKFDAHVLPGHRLVKNFFEAGGFSARSIVMHRDDDRRR